MKRCGGIYNHRFRCRLLHFSSDNTCAIFFKRRITALPYLCLLFTHITFVSLMVLSSLRLSRILAMFLHLALAALQLVKWKWRWKKLLKDNGTQILSPKKRGMKMVSNFFSEWGRLRNVEKNSVVSSSFLGNVIMFTYPSS